MTDSKPRSIHPTEIPWILDKINFPKWWMEMPVIFLFFVWAAPFLSILGVCRVISWASLFMVYGLKSANQYWIETRFL